MNGRRVDGCHPVSNASVTATALFCRLHHAPGSDLEAGVLNLTGSIDLQAKGTADTSFLAEIQRMMEAAEQGRGRYRRIADR
ncbi:MAG: hypothetical protein AAFO98_09660, partial [Pseudomonadota bacterium]